MLKTKFSQKNIQRLIRSLIPKDTNYSRGNAAKIVHYLNFLFTDLISKSGSNVVSETVFHHYANLPYYVSRILYKVESPLTFDNFVKFLYIIHYGSVQSLLKLTYTMFSHSNDLKSNATVQQMKSLLYNLGAGSQYKPNDFRLGLIDTIVDGSFENITEFNFEKYTEISSNINCDCFLIILFYILQSQLIDTENLGLFLKLKTHLTGNEVNTIESMLTRIQEEIFPKKKEHNKGEDPQDKINIDISHSAYNFILKFVLNQENNFEMEYVNDVVMDNSYEEDLAVLTTFEKDKESVCNKLDNINSYLNDMGRFNQTLPTNVLEENGFFGGGVGPQMVFKQTISPSLNQNWQKELLLPSSGNKKNINAMNLMSSSFKENNIYKYNCLMYIPRAKKQIKAKLYVTGSNEIFVLTLDKAIIKIITLTKNWGNTSNILLLDSDNNPKDKKFFKVKIYNDNSFFVQSKEKAIEIIRLLFKMTNTPICTGNKELNQSKTLISVKGKYEINLNASMITEENDIKFYKSDNFIVKVFLKKEGKDLDKEEYLFDLIKKLIARGTRDNYEFLVKPYDKFENSTGVFFIYSVSNDANNVMALPEGKRINLIRSFGYLYNHLNRYGIVINMRKMHYNSDLNILIQALIIYNNSFFLTECGGKIGQSIKETIYGPPEVLNGTLTGPWVDVWWFGNVAFYLMNGTLPFTDPNGDIGKIYFMILNRKISFSQSSKVNEIIEKSLEANWEKRIKIQEAFKMMKLL